MRTPVRWCARETYHIPAGLLREGRLHPCGGGRLGLDRARERTAAADAVPLQHVFGEVADLAGAQVWSDGLHQVLHAGHGQTILPPVLTANHVAHKQLVVVAEEGRRTLAFPHGLGPFQVRR